MNTLPALVLAAGGVGFGHAVMPDHWLPLAVLSRTRRDHPLRTVRLSLAAAVTHVVVSLALGAVLAVVGLQFRSTVARHTDLVVGALLLATGAVFLALDLLGKGHGHSHDDNEHHHGRDHEHEHTHAGHEHGHTHSHEGEGEEAMAVHAQPHTATAVLDHPHPHPHDHDHDHDHSRHETKRPARGIAGLLIPFGAAASPDLTILPVFLAAGALGTGAALGTLAAFALTTVVTIVGLTVAAATGARMLTAPWIDKRANLITALTLVAIGALVTSGVI